jgi:CRISPR-associated endonuclease/helicase Cas3
MEEAARALANQRGYKDFTVLEYAKAISDEEETPSKGLVLLANPTAALPASGDLSAHARKVQRLTSHTQRSEEAARRIVSKLGLPETVSEAVCIAARWHDKGKDRADWQKAINNFQGEPLAKSGRTSFNGRFTRGYRHEFGSLLDAEKDPVIREHAESELILHLIGSHHGHSRPGFSEQAYDRTFSYLQNSESSGKALVRFDHLQTRFGWWQLAWLEALVKSADAMGGPND